MLTPETVKVMSQTGDLRSGISVTDRLSGIWGQCHKQIFWVQGSVSCPGSRFLSSFPQLFLPDQGLQTSELWLVEFCSVLYSMILWRKRKSRTCRTRDPIKSCLSAFWAPKVLQLPGPQLSISPK